MTDPWLAKRTMATKIATMSNGPSTLGRMPPAIRSESSSPERGGAAVVLAMLPSFFWLLPNRPQATLVKSH